MTPKVLIVVALFAEAKAFIQKYSLKPVNMKGGNLFLSDEFALVVTGVGKVSSSSAVSAASRSSIRHLNGIDLENLC